MSASVKGRISWDLTRDNDGHRNYDLKMLVKCTSTSDGPNTVMSASGLPIIGSTWAYGNDNDPWAFCYPNLKVTPVNTGEPNIWWEVDQKFSTKPLSRCQDDTIEDPLQEPARISGSFARYQQEVERDRNSKLIKSSSHEVVRGIEKDASRPNVVIEFNSSTLQLEVLASMIDTVNSEPMWGLDSRKIKLTTISWDRRVNGTCNFYFTQRLQFEIRYEGWDIDDLVDKGFKCLRGKWNKSGTGTGATYSWSQDTGVDPQDPDDFIVAKDSNDENTPAETLLDGSGGRLTDPSSPVFLDTVELYPEYNFLNYGVPSTLS
jgi:hypothetical protein